MGDLIWLHPKLVNKWARRYIILYRRQGADVAKRWATDFLGPEARNAMSERVEEILHKRKRPPKGPGEKE